MFESILTNATSGLTLTQVLICLGASIACGLIIALTYRSSGQPSKNFLSTVAILPAIVQIVIMMVNGNLGVGVAVAGSFSLVRFRSLPGKSTDIAIVFLAMGAGLATGMGYVFFAVAMSAVVCLIFFAFSRTSFLESDPTYRYLRITIPEDLEYASVFDGIFKEYTKYSHLEQMRTVNLGSMYQVSYSINLKDESREKEMIDQIRCQNSNLSVISSRQALLTNTEL
jgi:uncharacterized membrane protein YhiD involved in acid resistance